MKIIRMTRDVLDLNKDEIRYMYDLDNKDYNPELYRILVPMVEDVECLNNLIQAFNISKTNVKSIKDKYSFHCANKEVVNTLNNAILN